MGAVDGGVIEAPAGRAHRELAWPRSTRRSASLIAWHEPVAVALEDVYFGRNVRSAIAVGQARGVALLAAAQRGVPCFDYTPQAVKLAVCGSGAARQGAGSAHGRHAARACREPPESDHAADALAVAICHAGHARTRPHALAAEPARCRSR